MFPLVARKIFCWIMLKRIQTDIDHKLRVKQASFQNGHSCIEHILQNIIEQMMEYLSSLMINSIDPKKAFHSVHRESLWKILQIYAIPFKCIDILKSLCYDLRCCIKLEMAMMGFFKIVREVQQGCILSHFLPFCD